MWTSSNPVLNNDDAFQRMYGHLGGMTQARPTHATISGVINKTGILVLIAILTGAAGYSLVGVNTSVIWISAIAAFVLCLGFGFVLAGKPQLSPILAPIYAAVEGLFLGSLTAVLDQALLSMDKAVPGGLALQAFIITVGVTVGMLALYRARIIRPTKTFQAVVGTLIAGVAITYIISFALSFFGLQLPFISLGSALQQGAPAWIGLGLNVFILGIAALTLILDFKMVEDRILGGAGAPKYMEWFCGFALLITIAWIYYEAVKLAFRIAAIMRR